MKIVTKRAFHTLQLAGEYGVYANGRMIQLVLPPKAKIRLSGDDMNKIAVNAPNPHDFCSQAFLEVQRARAERRIRKIAEWLKNRGLLMNKGNILFSPSLPLGLGIEDNIVYLTIWLLGPNLPADKIAQLVAEYEWEEGRKTCSYVYLLPAIWLNANPECHGEFILLEREMPAFKTWDEFERLRNSPAKIGTVWRWMKSASLIEMERMRIKIGELKEESIFCINVYGRPKVALPKKLFPSVEDAVTTLPIPRSWRLVTNLANLTDQAFQICFELQTQMTAKIRTEDGMLSLWWELGRLLTCYHFTMSAMQRTDPVSDQFVFEVSQISNVAGAKTTASGLGGTVIVLFVQKQKRRSLFKSEGCPPNVVDTVAERYGYTPLVQIRFGRSN